MRYYRRLDVWVEAQELAALVYRTTAAFPPDERYGLVKQIRRSASSVGANIAEGCGRESDRDFCRFLSISTGSLLEVESHLDLAERLGYVSHDQVALLLPRTARLQKMLFSLRRKVAEGGP